MAEPRVLLVCYVIGPGAGSEPGMSWNWARSLALAGAAVTVIAGPEFRDLVEQHDEPLGFDIEWVEQPTWIYRLPSIPVRVFLGYRLWLRRANARARDLHDAKRFDVAHHISWASLLQGSIVHRLGLPSVLGPVGGGQHPPDALSVELPHTWKAEQRRVAIIRSFLRSPLTRWRLRRSMLIASNPETATAVEQAVGVKPRTMLDDGRWMAEIAEQPPSGDGNERSPLRVAWIGSIREFRALDLALDVIEAASVQHAVHLTVLGDGPDRHLVDERLDSLTTAGLVTFRGWVTPGEVEAELDNTDVLLYTSLRDNGGAPIHDALAKAIPVVCIDHQGPGAIVATGGGIAVEVTDPATVRADLISALAELATDNTRFDRLRREALANARENSWERRGEQMIEIYGSIAELR